MLHMYMYTFIIWYIKDLQQIFANAELTCYSTGPDVTITRASISERGFPIITLSNHASYSLDTSVGAW